MPPRILEHLLEAAEQLVPVGEVVGDGGDALVLQRASRSSRPSDTSIAREVEVRAHEPGFALRWVMSSAPATGRVGHLRRADVVVHRQRLERGERADHRLHPVALDQLLHLGARLRRHAAAVGDGQLDLAAAQRVVLLLEEDG